MQIKFKKEIKVKRMVMIWTSDIIIPFDTFDTKYFKSYLQISII